MFLLILELLEYLQAYEILKRWTQEGSISSPYVKLTLEHNVATPQEWAVTTLSSFSLAGRGLLSHSHGTCSCARVFGVCSVVFFRAPNKPSFSDGYSPLLLLRGQTFSRGAKRRISYLKSRISTKKQENVHKPGEGKGCPDFKVTMEVPGMQVSWKVDSVVGLNQQTFVLCDSAAPSKVLLIVLWRKSLEISWKCWQAMPSTFSILLRMTLVFICLKMFRHVRRSLTVLFSITYH